MPADEPVPIVDSIAGAPDVHLLLIAAETESDEVEYNTHYQAVAGDRAALWVVPGGHTGALAGSPDEYEERIRGFFRSTLIDRGWSGS